MATELIKSMLISASGMRAQGQRLRVLSENLANANTLPLSPNEDPYRRKIITFRSELDKATGAEMVKVRRIGVDRSDFGMKYDPDHPGADANGYVRTPNVNSLIEMMDMKEAQRSYEANLNVIEASKAMLMRTIDILRS